MPVELQRELATGWMREHQIGALVDFLQSGTHHGKPGVPAALKKQLFGLFQETCTRAERVRWADLLMARDEPVARVVACGLVASGWELDPERTFARAQRLSEDGDWEVREWAADTLAMLLHEDFERALKRFEDWVATGSEEIRRAVALALSARARERVSREAKPMLALMGKLAECPGTYLQKNLGPFTLGGGFLARFPDETMSLLKRLSRRKDANVCWNVAMAFTSAASRRHAQDGAAILDRLAAVDAKVVRAIEKARKNLNVS